MKSWRFWRPRESTEEERAKLLKHIEVMEDMDKQLDCHNYRNLTLEKTRARVVALDAEIEARRK